MKPVRIGYARIRRHATSLLKEQSKPPVNLDSINQRLNIEVREMDLAADISGILYREDERRVILVNENHSLPRKRFTIAHEIGHLQLHRGDPIHVDSTFRINLRDPRSATAEDIEEVEANAFAANLLMPVTWLRAEPSYSSLDLNDDTEVLKLADRYQVSRQAMLVRLTTLT